MKKILLTLILGIKIASATSIMPTTLEYTKLSKSPQGISHRLSVYVNGSVVHRLISPLAPKVSVVTQLSANQMDRISHLIQKATPAVRGFEVSRVMCFAPASHTSKYVASHGSLFLREGASCDGGFDVNQRPAARKLVQILDFLERAAHQKLTGAEIDAGLNQ